MTNIYSLKKYNLLSETDFKLYNKVLITFTSDNILYSNEYFNSNNDANNNLCYFLFCKNDTPIILMPFNLRSINHSIKTDKHYFDVISPYGYSGPLQNNNGSISDLSEFWKSVDNWYKDNNVITEFIRFNLNENHLNYSGKLIPSLSNVKGQIIKEQDQWSHFKQKVRNNYRKALKEELKIEIHTNNINNNTIDVFYDIYIKTMQRNKADAEYFHPKEYFERLIYNHPNNTIIAIVYKDDIAISTELLFTINKSIYSYLGGTLANYFNMRPNDFLKIEMINWARKNNLTHYILGGGRTDNDSLYQYKKSFFPNDDDAIYYTGRKIINSEVYLNLINQIEVINYEEITEDIENPKAFFPSYRKLNTKNIAFENEFEVITSKSEWQATINKMDAHDFYHTYDYHKLSKADGECPVLLKYTEGNKLVCLPLLIRKIFDTEFYDATSVYGYCGPLTKNIDSTFDNINFQKLLSSYFSQNKIISVFSRLNPFIQNQECTINNIGEIIKLGNVVNIDLTIPLEEQRTLFSKTTKRYLNKGRKLIEIKLSNDIEDIKVFTQIYYENMDRVNAKKKYYFSEDYFYKFTNSEDFKTDILFATNIETNDIISAAMMVKTNNIVQYHISGTKTDLLHLSPIRLLIDEMRIKATNENYTYFNLGGGLGNEEDELFYFKSSFSKDFKPFKIWKHIVNQEIYNKLVKDNKIEKLNSDFFPLYRYSET